MPIFSANLSMLYKEFDFLDRFSAAAKDGFEFVEYLFPYDFSSTEIANALDDAGVIQSLFNLPPGNWSAGERGLAALPGREGEFEDGLKIAIEYARVTNCKRLHIMAGIVSKEFQSPEGLKAVRSTYVNNLKLATKTLEPFGITVLIEPINNRDMPGYFLNYQSQAGDILREVNEPNLKIQMDFYHAQIMEGDIEMTLRKNFNDIGHIQVASVPKRNEPDEYGELNYPYLFTLLDEIGYSGHVGCEYNPRTTTSENLKWLRDWVNRKSSMSH